MALCYPGINNHDDWQVYIGNAPGFPLSGYFWLCQSSATGNNP